MPRSLLAIPYTTPPDKDHPLTGGDCTHTVSAYGDTQEEADAAAQAAAIAWIKDQPLTAVPIDAADVTMSKITKNADNGKADAITQVDATAVEAVLAVEISKAIPIGGGIEDLPETP